MHATLAVALGLLSLGLVPAEERPEDTWSNLNVVKAGQRIRVVRTNMHAEDGAFAQYSAESITLRVKGNAVSVPRGEVVRVTLQERSKRLRNALIGMAIGGGAALAVGAALDASFSEDGENIAKAIFMPIGLGAGAGIGAAVPGYQTVYRSRLGRSVKGGSATP